MVVGAVGCGGGRLIVVVAEVVVVTPKVPSLPNWKSGVCLPEPGREKAGCLDSNNGLKRLPKLVNMDNYHVKYESRKHGPLFSKLMNLSKFSINENP